MIACYTLYDPASGAAWGKGRCGGQLLAAQRAAALDDGLDLLPVAVDPLRTWIDAELAAALREQPNADWEACVRTKSPSPATLVSAVDGALAVDLYAAPEVVINSIPPWSALRIVGPVSTEQSYGAGADTEHVRLHAPGRYRFTLVSSRHLTREWVIDAA